MWEGRSRLTANDPITWRPQRAPNVVARTLAGEAVLLNLSTEEYFSLNEVGSRIWDLMDGQRTVADITDSITTEYDAERADVLEDVLVLLDELAEAGLIMKRTDHS